MSASWLRRSTSCGGATRAPTSAAVRGHRCRTYAPGASSSGGNPSPGAPMAGGAPRPLECSASHVCQAGHQDPSCRGACARCPPPRWYRSGGRAPSTGFSSPGWSPSCWRRCDRAGDLSQARRPFGPNGQDVHLWGAGTSPLSRLGPSSTLPSTGAATASCTLIRPTTASSLCGPPYRRRRHLRTEARWRRHEQAGRHKRTVTTVEWNFGPRTPVNPC